jgi:TM2 domain-containing membrane protein YozV
MNISNKSWLITILLCIFLGFTGAHRFYTGYRTMAFLYLFTGGFLLAGVVYDLMCLVLKIYTDRQGKYVRN